MESDLTAQKTTGTGPSRQGKLADAVRQRRARRWIETAAALLLSLATVATAWCGYQASRWGGEMSRNFSQASAARIQSAQKSTEAVQVAAFHASLFVDYATAFSEDNIALGEFLFERFPPELKTATDAWIATEPRTNPNAPSSPFVMPEYVLQQQLDATELAELADARFSEALVDNQRSDNYVLLTVIFASVLFFGGISTRVESQWLQLTILGIAAITFIVAVITMLRYPVH